MPYPVPTLSSIEPAGPFSHLPGARGTASLGIITPIENQPSCSTAECHAHPRSQQVLGVLDTNLSLAKADVQITKSSAACSSIRLSHAIVAMLSWLFVWRVVDKPIKTLKHGTEHLTPANSGIKLMFTPRTSWGTWRIIQRHELQLRPRTKSGHLGIKLSKTGSSRKPANCKAPTTIIAMEKMASLGKMAAVVAHEVNNPLSGILTYAKLCGMDRRQATENEKREEAMQCLELIAAESRRCGDLIKNLLSFLAPRR